MMTTRFKLLALASILCVAALDVQAASIAVLGLFPGPGKAVLSIDGGPPRTLSVGQTINGVKLVTVEKEAVVVEAGGKPERIMMGGQPFAVSDSVTEGAPESISLTADERGHFLTQISINGVGINAMVDTGATSVAISPSQAERAGINYKNGEQVWVGTANGQAVAWRIQLDRVYLKGITLRNVDGMVMPMESPIALLGMSFLNRMKMERDGNTMTLKRRY